jgi:2'-5' RNA ligase
MQQATARLFLAVDLSPEVRSWLGRAESGLKVRIPPGSVRWVNVEMIHLTLKFLGETPSPRIDDVRTVMDLLARGCRPFPLVVEGLGCFPNAARPRVVWAGVRRAPDLLQLQQRVESELEPIGFPRERRGFSPHLTLGRVKEGVRSGEIGRAVESAFPPAAAEMKVDGWCLFQSVLRPGGAEYSILHRSEFTG